MRYLLSYNDQDHRSEKYSRLTDWLTHLPVDGLREMCTWEQICGAYSTTNCLLSSTAKNLGLWNGQASGHCHYPENR